MEYSTIRAAIPDAPSRDQPTPGVILIFSGDQPRCAAMLLDRGPIVLGRGSIAGVAVDDNLMSRRHARVAFDGATWSIEDLGSTNGTSVDGEPIRGEIRRDRVGVIRAGSSVFLALPDIHAFSCRRVRVGNGVVHGPALQEAYEMITRAAAGGESLLITGESGTGKELAARAFHKAGPQASGPFIAVNCAAIPEGLAERLLFGARRGAYSGATHDTPGYVQAAHGGTLFLDEVAELDASVQAKLLRTIDTRQVLALGAVAPRPVQIRVCAATHDLRARVSAGRFREDLYYRIGRPEVHLPPLRERREEIPWLLAACCRHADQPAAPALDVSLVVACVLRPWPGNIRELVGEARRAALRAQGDGRNVVAARDLDPGAGMGLVPSAQGPRRQAAAPEAAESKPRPSVPQDDIAEALRIERGNVTRAAQRLGIHRNKVRRWLEKNQVSRTDFAEDSGDPADV